MAKDMAFPKIGRNVLLIILAILVLVLVFRKNIMNLFNIREGARAKAKAPAPKIPKASEKAAAALQKAAAAAAAAAEAKEEAKTKKNLPDSVSFTGGSNITIEGNNFILPCVKGSPSGLYTSASGVTAKYRCVTVGNNSELYKKLKAAYTKAKNTVSTNYNNDIAEANKIISAAKTKRDTVISSIDKEFDTLRSTYNLIK